VNSLIETFPSYHLHIIRISTGSERNLYEYFISMKKCGFLSTLKL